MNPKLNPYNAELHKKSNLFGAWCGVAYTVIVLVAWWLIAGFYPLHEPSASAGSIATFYEKDIGLFRVGMILVMWCAAIYLPFASTVSDCVAKVEGHRGPLASTVLIAGYGVAMLTFYPALWWLTAGYRPETRSEELTFLLNDIGWLQFIGGISIMMPTYVAVAVAAFNDKSANPVFPRWVGYYSLWTFIILIPGQLLFFFKDGPFAWDGILAFWVPVGFFALWFLVIAFLIRKALLNKDE